MQTVQKMARKTTSCACEPCKRAKKRCDVVRPCSRCIRYGQGQMCADSGSLVSLPDFVVSLSPLTFLWQKQEILRSKEVIEIENGSKRYCSNLHSRFPYFGWLQNDYFPVENLPNFHQLPLFGASYLASSDFNFNDGPLLHVHTQYNESSAAPGFKKRRISMDEHNPVRGRHMLPVTLPAHLMHASDLSSISSANLEMDNLQSEDDMASTRLQRHHPVNAAAAIGTDAHYTQTVSCGQFSNDMLSLNGPATSAPGQLMLGSQLQPPQSEYPYRILQPLQLLQSGHALLPSSIAGQAVLPSLLDALPSESCSRSGSGGGPTLAALRFHGGQISSGSPQQVAAEPPNRPKI